MRKLGGAAHQGVLLEPGPDAQALNQVLVPFRVMAFQVFQQAAAAGDHRQQSTPGMMVFRMLLEMIVELENTLAQDRYLDLWRTGVRFMHTVLGNLLLLGIGRQSHARIDTPRLNLISFCSPTA